MSRILDFIAKYDEKLTIAQLREAIEADKVIADKKEADDFNQMKEQFNRTYLKSIEEDTLFGKILSIFYIEKIVSTERCTDWTRIYHVKGDKITFSEREIWSRELKHESTYDTFSKKELEEMTKITEQEYDGYKRQYEEVKAVLTDIVG